MVSEIHKVVNITLSFTNSIGGENIIAVYVRFDDTLIEKWKKCGAPCRLNVLKSKLISFGPAEQVYSSSGREKGP
ncbi:hypothetical protein [Neobacillus terrae]|uniref:hypothetical protein n=1 Tax=Neobacillus terrae TaxID=3034837 RepID=UPI00140CCD27|nr:hypothetical protein [Neobacillus terrae]NHM31150.1 hypothetical protein [Neobacillus terrae]